MYLKQENESLTWDDREITPSPGMYSYGSWGEVVKKMRKFCAFMKGGVYNSITQWCYSRVLVTKLDVALIGLSTRQKHFTCMQTGDFNFLSNSIILGLSSYIIKNIAEKPWWRSSVAKTWWKLGFSIIEFFI